MSQEINLYEERLRPRRQLVDARKLGVALVVVLVALAVDGALTRSAAERTEAELARVQGEVAASQKKLADLGKTLADLTVSAALQAELDATHAQLDSSQQVMAQLDSAQLGNNAGFAGIMAGFSRQASSHLWLTGFSVSDYGQAVEIRGRLLEAARLPAYVQGLASDPAFAGRRFDTLDVRRVDPSQPSAGDLATKPATSPEAKPESETKDAAAAALPPYVEFTLRSESSADRAAVAGGNK